MHRVDTDNEQKLNWKMFLPKFIKQNLWLFIALLFSACHNPEKKTAVARPAKDSATSCMMTPARFSASSADTSLKFNGETSVKDMVFIQGGTFMMGGDNSQASQDEYPKHEVKVTGFYIDAHEVTNAEFAKFVKATHYVTTAEKNRIGKK